jgi:hypothetical protein
MELETILLVVSQKRVNKLFYGRGEEEVDDRLFVLPTTFLVLTSSSQTHHALRKKHRLCITHFYPL